MFICVYVCALSVCICMYVEKHTHCTCEYDGDYMGVLASCGASDYEYGASKMVQQVKALATKPDNLSLIPGIHM